MITHEVVAAVIYKNDQILCAKRGEGKYPYISFKYEFPGGKVETGETNEAALIREIREELQLKIEVKQFLMTNEHTYPDFKIRLHSYLCTCDDVEPVSIEHVEIKWLDADQLHKLEWADADLPIVDELIKNV